MYYGLIITHLIWSILKNVYLNCDFCYFKFSNGVGKVISSMVIDLCVFLDQLTESSMHCDDSLRLVIPIDQNNVICKLPWFYPGPKTYIRN